MYQQLLKELNQFLLSYLISINDADIFEETLLKLARITEKPARCRFSSVSDCSKQDAILFIIWGISEDDARLWLAWFKQEGVFNARTSFSDYYHAHCFIVDVEMIYEKIFPIFKQEIERLAKICPSDLLSYQQKSADSIVIKELKLLRLVEEALQAFSWLGRIFNTVISYIGFSSEYQHLITVKSFLKEGVLYDDLRSSREYFHNKVKNDALLAETNPRLSELYDLLRECSVHQTPNTSAYRLTTQNKHSFCTHIFISKFASASLRLKRLSKHGLTHLPVELQANIALFLTNHQYNALEENSGLMWKETLSVKTCKFGEKNALVYPENLSKEQHEAVGVWAYKTFLLFNTKHREDNKKALEGVRLECSQFLPIKML